MARKPLTLIRLPIGLANMLETSSKVEYGFQGTRDSIERTIGSMPVSRGKLWKLLASAWVFPKVSGTNTVPSSEQETKCRN